MSAVLRILVVDDDEMMLRILAPRLAGGGGVLVLTATTPQAALDQVPAEGPLAVVTDFNLKAAINGIELLRRIALARPDAVRILMSGYAQEQIGVANEPALHAFIEKDLRLDNIVRPIQRAIRARHPGYGGDAAA